MERAGEEDPQQVEHGDDQQQVAAPVVDVADELPEHHLVPEGLDRRVGRLLGRLVDEQQEDAGRHQQEYQHHGRPAQAKGPVQAQRRHRHLPGVDVQDQVREAALFPLAFGSGDGFG